MMSSVLQVAQAVSIVIFLCAIPFEFMFLRRMRRGNHRGEVGFWYSNAVVTTAALSVGMLWLAMMMQVIWIHPVSVGLTIGFFIFLSYRIRQRWAFDEKL